MPVLIVVAHPDDEVLGCGGTAALLASRGEVVRSCIVAADADVRQHRPDLPDLHADTVRAQQVLGLGNHIAGGFPNIRLNTIPTVELVRFIEQAIADTGADVIFTHHPGDLNDDHLHVARATQAAARLFQRRKGIQRLRGLYFMEVLSSTEWAFAGGNDPFVPDTFCEVGEAMLLKKIAALEAYRGVMRDFPHPRSPEILRGLAAFRGGQAGMRYAEAFRTAFSIFPPA
jgi:LmbE family N-acetylglucosaminyl deacetylase